MFAFGTFSLHIHNQCPIDLKYFLKEGKLEGRLGKEGGRKSVITAYKTVLRFLILVLES